jgi:hypothetical protein
MELWAWGSNSYGQLGLGMRNEQFEVPQRVSLPLGLSHVQSLSAGGGHTLVLDDQGQTRSQNFPRLKWFYFVMIFRNGLVHWLEL